MTIGRCTADPAGTEHDRMNTGGKLSAVALAAAPPGEQKQMIREELYPAVCR